MEGNGRGLSQSIILPWSKPRYWTGISSLRHYTGNCLEVLRKPANSCQGSRFLGRRFEEGATGTQSMSSHQFTAMFIVTITWNRHAGLAHVRMKKCL
jgi:hypothetical protein